MRQVIRVAAMAAVLALVSVPVLAGSSCYSSKKACGTKAGAAGGCARSSDACGFTDVLTRGACCKAGAHKDVFESTQVDLLETSDGYIAVVAASSPGSAQVVQAMVRTGWQAVKEAKDASKLCGLCREMRQFVSDGAEVEIYPTSAGVVVVAKASKKDVAERLRAYTAKIRAAASGDRAEAQTQS